MKKINKSVKVGNYFLGGFIQDQFSNIKKNIGNIATNAASAVSDIAGGLIPSSGDAKLDAITGGISSGLETVGSAFGPIGSAIGKAAGMLTKGVGAIIGSKGSVNTDTGELTKGKGIRGRRNKDELYAQYGRVNQGISDKNQTALIQQEWAQEHGTNDYSLAAEGGILPTTLAYLDDGELIRTPSGEIQEIPEEGKPQDSNLAKVPVGTQVLSDKLKVPGTNKTFAERGKEIMKTNKYKGNDKYAENSKKLNDWNAQIAYDKLLELQESLKSNKKNKKSNAYSDGTKGIMKNTNWNNNFGGKYKSIAGTIYANKSGKYNDFSNRITDWLKDDNNLNTAWKDLGSLPQVTRAMKKYGNDKRKALQANYSDNKYGEVHDWFTRSIDSAPVSTPEFKKMASNTPSFAALAQKPIMPNKISIPEQKQNSKSTDIKTKFKFDELLGNLAGLAGPIANIASATPEKARVFTYTPQFAPTEYDITPLLREIDLSNAITRYNINQAGGAGTGANLAQAIQGQVARDRSIAQAYNYKNNIENERKGRNTGIYNDWARYNTEAFHRGYVEDAQNRAAADQIRRTGIRDLSTALQTMSKDRRLAKRDQATLAAMEPFLQYGMTGEQYQKLMSLLR